MCVDSSGAACCGSCESMTVVRAIVTVLKMVMLKAMERGIMSKAAGRACCLTELNCLRARAEL